VDHMPLDESDGEVLFSEGGLLWDSHGGPEGDDVMPHAGTPHQQEGGVSYHCQLKCNSLCFRIRNCSG
jgi:hypothetical protein